MPCHCGTNNRAQRWTFTDPCKPEVGPGSREESASPVWLAAPAINARDTKKAKGRVDREMMNRLCKFSEICNTECCKMEWTISS